MGPPKLQKIDIIAVGIDYKILIHFKWQWLSFDNTH